VTTGRQRQTGHVVDGPEIGGARPAQHAASQFGAIEAYDRDPAPRLGDSHYLG
jgi:hypothetical protein